jgi:hypothetical protein
VLSLRGHEKKADGSAHLPLSLHHTVILVQDLTDALLIAADYGTVMLAALVLLNSLISTTAPPPSAFAMM